jgi:hypothetical protein
MEDTDIVTAEPIRPIVNMTDVNGEIVYQASNYSTINPATKEAVKIIANAINSAKSLNAAMEDGVDVFNVIGIMTEPGIRKSRDANGVDAPCTNTTLVCEDGNAYFTQSEGIRKSADTLYKLGVFEPGEPVTLSVDVTKTGNGNTIKSLRMI